MRLLVRIGLGVPLVALAGVALWPLADRALVQHEIRRQLRALDTARRAASVAPCTPSRVPLPLLPMREEPPLASWGRIGGCGAGGGSASTPGGAIKWVGRNVTGGLLDVQCLTSQTEAHASWYSTFLTRLGTSGARRWGTALYVPVLYKVGDVSVLGQSKTAHIAGFGDVSLEVSRKLGTTESHYLALMGSTPTGAPDAIREGIVLPQRLQLGSGVPGLTAQYQYTRDRDWGLVLIGGTMSYNGWENRVSDSRAPTATASTHLGYILGPLVPSTGLTLFGKPAHDRERGASLTASRDPLFMLIPSLGLEWSSDYLAVMLAGTVGLSLNGMESVTLGLGVSSSLF